MRGNIRLWLLEAVGIASLLLVLYSFHVATTSCVTEDSANCRWDAEIQGNGSGRSFIDVGGDAYYLEGE